MAIFSLLDTERQETLPNEIAPSRAAALAEYSRKIGKKLVDRSDGSVPRYLLDEWDDFDGVHTLNHHIEIWVAAE